MLTANGARKHVYHLAKPGKQDSMLREPVFNEFCKYLSPQDCEVVTSTVNEIARLRKQMVANMLAIGEGLLKLRATIGSEKFSAFMTQILPTLGISRSTGYRWMGFADKLAHVFPNPIVRQQLMVLTDGKGIVSNAQKEGKRGPSKVVLTRAAEQALKVLPPLPNAKQSPSESEQWVRQFLCATAKARALDRTPGRNIDKDQQVIVRRFNRFALQYGPSAAEDLCGRLDKILNHIADTSRASRTSPSQS
jgi:hypothetical protein